MKQYYVYIMANDRPTLYVGVTNNLYRRAFEHKQRLDGFTARYHVDKLVYFEEANDVEVAIRREKRLKHWNRQWKLDLIQAVNPTMRDLSLDWSDSPIESENDNPKARR